MGIRLGRLSPGQVEEKLQNQKHRQNMFKNTAEKEQNIDILYI